MKECDRMEIVGFIGLGAMGLHKERIPPGYYAP